MKYTPSQTFTEIYLTTKPTTDYKCINNCTKMLTKCFTEKNHSTKITYTINIFYKPVLHGTLLPTLHNSVFFFFKWSIVNPY